MMAGHGQKKSRRRSREEEREREKQGRSDLMPRLEPSSMPGTHAVSAGNGCSGLLTWSPIMARWSRAARIAGRALVAEHS